jgi:glutathione synthase
MQLGIAINRAASMDTTWTTIHIAVAAVRRGHAVRFVEPWDYEIDDASNLCARVHAFDPAAGDPPITAEQMVDQLRTRSAKRRYIRLSNLDVLLVRAAPFSPSMLALAATVQDQGVMVVNDPAGLLRVSHKGWLASLRDVPTPPTLVTQSRGAVQLFMERHRTDVVIKPAQGSGGRDVALVKMKNARALERAFRRARGIGKHVVVQAYLPDAEAGEKRLVWMDGVVLGGYLRLRAPGEFRHNLKQGGTAVATSVTEAEHAAVAPLSAHLLKLGIRLAGIDLIGNHIIEVNALNPGGAYHADRLGGTDIAGTIIEWLDSSRPPSKHGRNEWAHPVP